MTISRALLPRLAWVVAFAAGFSFVESSVVVYLRSLYYPEGFAFPLRLASNSHLTMEAVREAATLVMLTSVAALAGTRAWERVGYFLLAFGVWDLLYYVWLRVLVGWPQSLLDWDVLFLIPIPWVGPVMAATALALLMVVIGTAIILRLDRGLPFRPALLEWVLGITATAVILFSFLSDTGASLHGAQPRPYSYGSLVLGVLLFIAAFIFACRRGARGRK